jgi:Calpain family cysteine protease
MPEKQKENISGTPQNCAVINPYALAELVAGRKINWKEVKDKRKMLEELLLTPYEELFDPIYEGPLYMGLRVSKNNKLERVRSPLLDVNVRVDVNDLESSIDAFDIKFLRDLSPRFNVKDVGDIPVHSVEMEGQRYLRLKLRVPERERWLRLAQVFTKAVVESVAPDPERSGKSQDWTPPNGTWIDPGRFFNEASEFFDPIQGAVANCYYIAALSAVAWAMPYRIKHLTRATGVNQQQFTNMIHFYKPDSNGVVDKEIEVTDAVPLNNATNDFIYARSSEISEIWPAVYEKAFAKLVTGHNGDRPDITATAWGDCVLATAQLTGGKRHYYDTGSSSADELWNLVRANSLSMRTFNPMTAWTYSTGDASEKKIVYSDANIVASHCYAILGWEFRNDRKYIILRNPWGHTEATLGTLNDTVFLYDISWWRPINLAVVDGTFAIEAAVFKTYFAGMGVAK